VIDGQQATTWVTDPTRFDVGNVDLHSLLLAPAERADVIVDFSRFAGQTLILYNDAPAAFPARVPSYDYYTGAPDMSPNGAPAILPGYGPNTRTIMQVKIRAATPAPAFNLTKLQNAFKHNAAGTGVFEFSQHPIIVGQAAYNSAYGTSFAASSNCNAPGSTLQRCDGLVRINDTQSFGFNTLRAPNTKQTLPLQPKAIHDEMNSTTFDEFGRMQANLGVEAQPPTPGAQNVTLYPYTNPSTELIDGTNLPRIDVTYDANGQPVGDVKIAAIANMADGTQIWRITHNGVDTHPIHFHLYDVQLLNRVTWDNIILATEPNELGWKDTVRIAPLEDTIVALRPVIPELPWELPNAIRNLSPMNPTTGPRATMGFWNVDPQGNPTAPIQNQLVNFGWEYVYHCHILSHEEMDMMRPVSVAMPPVAPNGLVFNKATRTLAWTDNSIAETAYVVQRTTDGVTWSVVGASPSPLDQPNTAGGIRTLADASYDPYTDYQYRVVAQNTVGYGAEFPSMTVQSMSPALTVNNPPQAPSNLSAALAFGPQITLVWRDNASNETGFVIERATGNGAFSPIGTVGANVTTFVDATGQAATTYVYRVAAQNTQGLSLYSNTVQVVVPAAPAAPTNLTAALQNGAQIGLTWRDNATNETGFLVERATDGVNFAPLTTVGSRNNTGNVSYVDTTTQPGFTYTYRVAAINTVVRSGYSNTAAVSVPVPTLPVAPNNLTAAFQNGPQISLTWRDNATNETGFIVQRSADGVNFVQIAAPGARNNTGNVTFVDTTVQPATTYIYRVAAANAGGQSTWSNTASAAVPALPGQPAITSITAARQGGGERVTVRWSNVNGETGYTIQWSTTNWGAVAGSGSAATNATQLQTGTITRQTWWFRVGATNGAGTVWSTPVAVAAAP
jgi:FtsP/CotA-like multicopper oxidase with cupredoxin domain